MLSDKTHANSWDEALKNGMRPNYAGLLKFLTENVLHLARTRPQNLSQASTTWSPIQRQTRTALLSFKEPISARQIPTGLKIKLIITIGIIVPKAG